MNKWFDLIFQLYTKYKLIFLLKVIIKNKQIIKIYLKWKIIDIKNYIQHLHCIQERMKLKLLKKNNILIMLLSLMAMLEL